MRFLRYSWLFPFLVLLFVYGNETLGFFLGDPEHYEILSGIGLSYRTTVALTWLSLLIEIGIMGAIVWEPSLPTFSVAALWPMVPRLITALTGAGLELPELELSLVAGIAALSAYLLHDLFKHSDAQAT